MRPLRPGKIRKDSPNEATLNGFGVGLGRFNVFTKGGGGGGFKAVSYDKGTAFDLKDETLPTTRQIQVATPQKKKSVIVAFHLLNWIARTHQAKRC